MDEDIKCESMPVEWKPAEKEVRVQQVIITRNARRGRGVAEDPLRVITQIWSMDGELIAENDPLIGFSVG
jgi:hypothetical protein